MRGSDNRWMMRAAPIWSIPFLVPIATLIGLFAGVWLDGRFSTKPWLSITLTLLGLAAGIYEAAKILIDATRENRD